MCQSWYLYCKLFDRGSLEIADGLRVQKPEQLWDMIRECWGRPQLIVLDRFRLAEFQDAIGNKAQAGTKGKPMV